MLDDLFRSQLPACLLLAATGSVAAQQPGRPPAPEPSVLDRVEIVHDSAGAASIEMSTDEFKTFVGKLVRAKSQRTRMQAAAMAPPPPPPGYYGPPSAAYGPPPAYSAAPPTNADARVAALEQRIGQLTGKLDQLIAELQRQAPVAPRDADALAIAPSDPYARRLDEENAALRAENDRLRSAPATAPAERQPTSRDPAREYAGADPATERELRYLRAEIDRLGRERDRANAAAGTYAPTTDLTPRVTAAAPPVAALAPASPADARFDSLADEISRLRALVERALAQPSAAAAPAAVASAETAPRTPRAGVAEAPALPAVLFEYDSSELGPQGKLIVQTTAAAYRRADGTADVELQGYASQKGSAKYNKALSERRAVAVKDLLMIEGVPASSIRVLAEGEDPDRPAALARRVELDIVIRP